MTETGEKVEGVQNLVKIEIRHPLEDQERDQPCVFVVVELDQLVGVVLDLEAVPRGQVRDQDAHGLSNLQPVDHVLHPGSEHEFLLVWVFGAGEHDVA